VNNLFRKGLHVFRLAILSQHIPEESTQMIRYYGFYSNKMRGWRLRKASGALAFGRPDVSFV
jgi:hypothetical protein